jgi:hypothetical protein
VKNGTAVPRLTLGLPTYNGEEFLAESLDALLAQTFTDLIGTPGAPTPDAPIPDAQDTGRDAAWHVN